MFGFCLTSWNDSFILLLSIKPHQPCEDLPIITNSVLYKVKLDPLASDSSTLNAAKIVFCEKFLLSTKPGEACL